MAEIMVHNYRNELLDCMVHPNTCIEIGIMQSKGALLGNPYYKKPRGEGLGLFRMHLWLEVEKPEFTSEIRIELFRLANLYLEGNNIVLTCCCAPLPCHGDVIKAAIIWIAAKLEGE